MNVTYGRHAALHDVSLRIPVGEALGVIGPNGAGKTTLIDAITGFVPYDGTVLVGGEAVDGLAPHLRSARGIARTFQSIELFDDLDVRENTAVNPRATHDAVEAALAATDLISDASRMAGALPRATQRLVGLARALASAPALLLLDEIGSGLDATEREALARRLRDIVSSGTALLMVDHDVEFVEAVCGDVIVLDAGEVVPRSLPGRRSTGERRDGHVRPGTVAAVDVVGVTVRGDRARPLHDITLHVDPGEIVALTGPNGGGKSTLLRAVCGFVPVTAGSITIVGTDVTRLPVSARARLGLAAVVEDRAVFQGLTVAENLRVGGAAPQHIRDWLASWVPDLVPLLDRRAGLLSGGEQALVALARALVRAPRVLLVDEISAGLAPGYLNTVTAATRRAATELGTAVMLVEQHPDVLESADRVEEVDGGSMRVRRST
jgi:ABC-type branched-subunit amino acid transport system ATPase component